MATKDKKEAPQRHKGSPSGSPELKQELKHKQGDDRAGAEDEDLGDQGPYAGRDACPGCAPQRTDY